MLLSDLFNLLNGLTGFSGKVAYYAFPEGEAPALPFICYFESGTNNFGADGVVFHEVKRIQIELYSKNRDTASESIIEEALRTNGIFWNKAFTYLDDERCYETIYDVEV